MREVIMYFCHMGILERVKNKGTFIREISTEKLEKDIAFCFQLAGYGFEDLDLLYRLQRSGAYLEKYYDLNNVYST